MNRDMEGYCDKCGGITRWTDSEFTRFCDSYDSEWADMWKCDKCGDETWTRREKEEETEY